MSPDVRQAGSSTWTKECILAVRVTPRNFHSQGDTQQDVDDYGATHAGITTITSQKNEKWLTGTKSETTKKFLRKSKSHFLNKEK